MGRLSAAGTAGQAASGHASSSSTSSGAGHGEPRGRLRRWGGPPARRGRGRVAAARAGGAGDTIVHAVDGNNEVRVCVMTATELVQSAIERHEMAPTAAAALGRALMGTSMLAVGKEEGESVQTFFKSDGPLGNILCVADSSGNVKGRVGNSRAHVEPRASDGKLDVGGVLGRSGTLSVSRTLPWSKEPYTGVCELHNGEIAEDFAVYLAKSEQINSAIGLGVSMGRDAGVEAAAGYLVQVMPDCSDRTVEMLEVNVGSLSPPTELLSEGRSASDIANLILDGLSAKVVSEFTPTYGPCEKEALKVRDSERETTHSLTRSPTHSLTHSLRSGC